MMRLLVSWQHKMSDQNLWVAIIAEAIIVILVLSYLFRNERKRTDDRSEVNKVIKRIKKDKDSRQEELKEVLHIPSMDQLELDDLLNEIHYNESKLYQHVVKIFLKKEVTHLKALDKHVKSLSDPYWKILKKRSEETIESPGNEEELKQLQTGLQVALDEKDRLSEHLAMALKTLDEVSAEYTNMFDKDADLTELNESKKRMMAYFEQAVTVSNPSEDSEDEMMIMMEDI